MPFAKAALWLQVMATGMRSCAHLSGLRSMQTLVWQSLRKEAGVSETTCCTRSRVFMYSRNRFINTRKWSALRMLPGTHSITRWQLQLNFKCRFSWVTLCSYILVKCSDWVVNWLDTEGSFNYSKTGSFYKHSLCVLVCNKILWKYMFAFLTASVWMTNRAEKYLPVQFLRSAVSSRKRKN